MAYDVDHDYSFREDEGGFPYLPEGMTERDGLYVLPNGRYLPPGSYRTSDGGHLIYEPHELSSFSAMLKECVKS